MDFRQQIDEIDDEIVRLFKERMNVSREIACYKREHGLSTLDAAREQEKLASIDEKAGAELRTYAHTLYSTILKLSRAYQDSV
jgi:chorismate mutase/prephenate dehydratase